ncbi:MAG: VWA domain-containing protein [Puniceicoccales bacterium]|jgi:Ca-activated chloride channel family protein|nr:VWA domain-containing protein [Puniceicoccales bacterium]
MMNSFQFHSKAFLWLLLFLPLIAYIYRRKRWATLSFPQVETLKKVAGMRPSKAQKILTTLRFLALGLLILALARPQLIDHFSESHCSGVDIMLAIDISSSMMGLDFQEGRERNIITRLDIAKQVTREFIRNRPNDRMGMCTFAGNAYWVSPITMNHRWLEENLERLHVGLIEDKTAIGNAIAMCVNRLKDSDAKTKLILLLTDGSNTAGDIAPSIAAEMAAALGIKIYTIGIGKKGTIALAYPDENGNVVTDSLGRPLIVQAQIDLDENLLQTIADKTDGQFFRGENRKQLDDIYKTIDRLEKTDINVQQFANAKDLFPWFIGFALLLLLLEYLLRNSKFQRIP